MSSANAVILGTGMSVPERVLTNFDLEKMVDTSDQWIQSRSGIRERRIAAEDETLSPFAAEAARQALTAAGVAAEQIDLLILATVTPDMPIPATACTVQHQLGCTRAAAFDIAAGCSGFIYAQSIAKQFLLSGRCEHALVIGAELLSKYLDWTDRGTCVLFADGAGAVVMGRGAPPRGVLASAMHSDGSMADYICMPGGGTLHPPGQKMVDERLHFIRMKGNETFKMAVRCIEEVCREVLETAQLSPSDVDWFVPHQANRRIIDAVGVRLGIGSERCYLNIDRYGNTSAASIPIALDEAVRARRIVPGNLVLMAAFGAGLTWAASVVRW
jgi:3-oxoacyl-[acyl-carrier-protein] synthase-3